MTLLHHLLDRAVADHPDAVALTCGDETVTVAGLDAAARRAAGVLAGSGVRRGDRVVVCVPTDAVVPALLFACSRAGAVFSVVHERTPVAALVHVLEDCEPAVLVTDDPAAQVAAVRRGVKTVTSAEVRAGAEAEVEVPVPAVDPVCLIYTSGSTGRPKAVVSTHAQVVFAATAIQSVLAYRRDDVVFCALPLSFDYGLYQVFLGVLSGACVRLATAEDAGPGCCGSWWRTGRPCCRRCRRWRRAWRGCCPGPARSRRRCGW
nr:hypothetical protein GCM10017745_36380 [Saccharothrix mutabilis subsp. capreolus]